jgi:hypothetical protein
MFRKLSRICAVFIVLSALLLATPAAHAGPQVFQRLDDSSWDLGGWIDALRLWLQDTLGKDQGAPETRMEVVTGDMGGPTGPCIDPQGGTNSASCLE